MDSNKVDASGKPACVNAPDPEVSVMSVVTESALPPLPISSSANDRMRLTRRAPSPLLAPVMTTTFPSILLLAL